jgi:hypothetical protein
MPGRKSDSKFTNSPGLPEQPTAGVQQFVIAPSVRDMYSEASKLESRNPRFPGF